MANTVVLAYSGKDIGETIASAFGSGDKLQSVEGLADETTAANVAQIATASALRTGQPLNLLPNRSINEVEPTHVSSAATYLPSHLSRSTQAIGNDPAAAAEILRSVEPASVQSSIPSSLLAMANASNGGQPEGPPSQHSYKRVLLCLLAVAYPDLAQSLVTV